MKAMAGGVVAGAVGTLAMDLVWFRRSRTAGSDASFGEFEFSGATTSFDDAGGPAEVGQTAAEAVGAEIPEKYAGRTTDVVHWLTGSGWAVGGSVLAALTGIPVFAAGLASGAASFAGAYTILPTLGIYDPIWEYEGKTLWKDATAHATYGAATGAALLALSALPRAT
jgi:hypothetical protein